MSTQKSWRRKASTLLATGTAALVAVTGMLAVPAVANATEAPAPVVTVSKTSGINPQGERLTISGSGFDASAKGLPAYYGCGEGSELMAQGFYVQVGWIKDTWRPSSGGKAESERNPIGDRKGGPNTWFADGVNCKAPEAWTIDEDGTASFTYSVDVSKEALGDLPEGARYAVFTHGAGGDTRAINEVSQEISFSPSTVTPSVKTATKGKLAIEAKISGIPNSSGGVYAALAQRGNDQLTEADMGMADYIIKSKIVDGSATALITIEGDDLNSLDPTKNYQVIVWEHQSFPTAENTYARADIDISKAQWDAVFKKDEPKPEVKVPFTDVKKGQKFYNEIAWMYTAKVTTGVKQADGSVKYMPKANVTREAMAAFLFRQYGDKNYQAPKNSKFTDVKFGDKFYKEIAWMDSKGYSTGVKQANGTVKYMPKANVTREAMAAFIYRIEKGAGTGKSVVFNDVKPGQKFFKEINWMSGTGITTGIKQSNGTYNYAPKANVTREAMAAFLYRADKL